MSNRLNEIRTEKKMTLKQLERKTGVSDSTLHRIENNTTDPTLSVMCKIAKGLKLRLEDIFQCD